MSTTNTNPINTNVGSSQTLATTVASSSSAAAAAASASASAASSLPLSPSGNSSITLPSNRFELELEFIQSLASPAYLHYLATSGVLYQSSFLEFLRYLRYWKQPEYAKYLSYPHCLYFLDLLVPPSPAAADDAGENVGNIGGNVDDDDDGDGDHQMNYNSNDSCNNISGVSAFTEAVMEDSGEAFRREIAQVQFRNFVHEQQFYSWQFRSARLYGKGSAAAAAAAVGGSDVVQDGGGAAVDNGDAASGVVAGAGLGDDKKDETLGKDGAVPN